MQHLIMGNTEWPPDSPDRPEWSTVAVKICAILLLLLLAVLLIRFLRRGGAAVALAAAGPLAVATLLKSPSIGRVRTRPQVDQDRLLAAVREIGATKSPKTPTELCQLLNAGFEQRGLAVPFESPQQMAQELKKLGLQSSVRVVPGRSERRWYDLSGRTAE